MYVLPLTFKVTFALFIALHLLSFKITRYFLIFTLALKVFFEATNFDVAFLTITLTFVFELIYLTFSITLSVTNRMLSIFNK